MKRTSEQYLAHPGLFSHASSDISLTTFISQLNKMLPDLYIVNGPNLNAKNLHEIQQVIKIQLEELEQYGFQYGTTAGLVHFAPGDKNDIQKLKQLNINKIREYHAQDAKITLRDKKCTCVGLCSAIFDLAKENLKQYAGNNITVEICVLRNWSHTLMCFKQRKKNGNIESLFYDPWYQRCYTTNPNEPKLFSDDGLGKEMEKLIRQTDMIRPTKVFLDINTGKLVNNTRRDFAYFIACSTDEFANPAPEIPDPTRGLSFNCLIS